MDYKELRELAVATSGMPAGMFGHNGINGCNWLFVGTCPYYDVPGKQAVLISFLPLIFSFSFSSIIACHGRGPGGSFNL